MKKISVIIPFYNEEGNIQKIYEEVNAVRRKCESCYEFEILFMDNHSSDQSFSQASSFANVDPACKVLRLSRNFGYQSNILAGFMNCTGDAAIQLDADGEDDPALIPEFIAEWERGFKVVYGVRRRRVEGLFLSLQRKVFYRLLNALSEVHIPHDAGDFRLIDRCVIEALKKFPEANPFLRGLIAYVGFDQVGIVYDRRPRYSGVSKFSWWDYVRLAWSSVTSFSPKPLDIATYMGLTLSLASFAGAIFYFTLYVLGTVSVRGFTTLILVQLCLAGVQLLCIGLTGKYIGAIFEQVKRRPRSIVERSSSGE
jgi:polyisoprenyl-phosphate glycosyltransferase